MGKKWQKNSNWAKLKVILALSGDLMIKYQVYIQAISIRTIF